MTLVGWLARVCSHRWQSSCLRMATRYTHSPMLSGTCSHTSTTRKSFFTLSITPRHVYKRTQPHSMLQVRQMSSGYVSPRQRSKSSKPSLGSRLWKVFKFGMFASGVVAWGMTLWQLGMEQMYADRMDLLQRDEVRQMIRMRRLYATADIWEITEKSELLNAELDQLVKDSAVIAAVGTPITAVPMADYFVSEYALIQEGMLLDSVLDVSNVWPVRVLLEGPKGCAYAKFIFVQTPAVNEGRWLLQQVEVQSADASEDILSRGM